MTKNNSRKYLWYSLIVVLLVVLLVVAVKSFSGSNKRIDYTEFKSMVTENQVSDVYVDDYTIYIRKTDSSIKSKNFPSKYDYYCKYMNNNVLMEFLEKHNDNLKEVKNGDTSLGYFLVDSKGEFVKQDGTTGDVEEVKLNPELFAKGVSIMTDNGMKNHGFQKHCHI